MNHSSGNKITKNYMLIPIIAALGFVPLIVHMHQYSTGMEDYAWFPSESATKVDMFLFWKGASVVFLAGIMLVLLAVQAVKKKKEFRMENAFCLLLIYALFALMSALFSQYKPQVFTGTYEIFQPIGVLLGYLVLCCYTYNCADTEQKVKSILLFSSIGLGIMLVIGLSQFAGFDLLQTTAGKLAMSDARHLDKLDSINFTMPKYTVYATLYNPDFLSFYFGLLTPVVVAAFVSVKKVPQRILLGAAITGCVLCLAGAGAASGYLAFAIAMAAGLFILLSRKKKTFRIGLAVTAVLVSAGITVCAVTPAGAKMEHLFLGTQRSLDSRAIKSMETADDGIWFDVNGNRLRITYAYDTESGEISVDFYDKDGQPIPAGTTVVDNSTLIIPDTDSYAGCQVEPVMLDDVLSIRVNMDGIDWYFTNQTDGTYYYHNPFGKWEKLGEIKKSRLFRDDAMSGRGNIWNLTIPQLAKHLVMGSGTNTFGFVYPQNDYVYKNYIGQPTVLTIKAHNWYLQEWVENGLLALICLLGFYIWYFVRSLRIYRRCSMKEWMPRLGFGIFAGTIGYMAAGMASDANVCTAPVFWVMLGLGMAVNRMIVEKEELFPAAAATGEPEETAGSADRAKEQSTAPQPVSGKKSGKKKSRKERKKH